jgi:uncharacterized protein YbjQ (UPF0145 family)
MAFPWPSAKPRIATVAAAARSLIDVHPFGSRRRYGADDADPRGPAMLIATTNDLPGYRIDEVIGEVWGLTVRSRNAFSQIGAGLKSLMGGELKGMTKALYESRNECMNRMIEEAQRRGADAIVAMRFDTSEMGDVWTELCAYGTAVRVTKL